jgi:hypothetical protein
MEIDGASYSIRIPEVAPSGQPVEILKFEREGIRRVHARSPDESEVYFEVTSYPMRVDHDEAAAEQRSFLAMRCADATMTSTSKTLLRSAPATEFRFEGTLQGRYKVRRFAFVDSRTRTYRIVYDPRSDVNERILESLEIDDAH